MVQPPDIEDKEFQIATAALEDHRRFLSSHKVQRWEVLKWGVSVNLALAVAAASPAVMGLRISHKLFLVYIGAGVVLASWLLIDHYNRLMTRVRTRHVGHVIDWLRQRGLDYTAITGVDLVRAYSSGEDYDRYEIGLFTAVLMISLIAIVLSVLFF
jgi:hypothetical protein